MDSAPNMLAETEKDQRLLPHELIVEILSRLPIKCLIRFKCVCKLWIAVIQERYFIEKHLQRAKYTRIYSPDVSLNNVHNGEETFFHLTTVDGLLVEKCCNSTSKYRIRNPETKQLLYLPDPLERPLCAMCLFYLPISKKYKIIYPFKTTSMTFGGCKVLTLEETDLKWRTLVIPSLNNINRREVSYAFTRADPIFFLVRHGYSEVVCIEMESECFSSVKIPGVNSFSDCKALQILIWNGKFSLAKSEDKEGEWKFNIWILEDHRKQKWVEEMIVIPSEVMRLYAGTKITLREVNNSLLRLSSARNTVDVRYDTESKEAKLTISPTGKRLLGFFRPSLVCIEGMRRE